MSDGTPSPPPNSAPDRQPSAVGDPVEGRAPSSVSASAQTPLATNKLAVAALVVAMVSAAISMFAAAANVSSATNVARNDRRENEVVLGEAVRAQGKLDARALERIIRRFVSDHREELVSIASASPEDGPKRRLAKRLGDDLLSQIETQQVNAVGQCREVLSLMNRAGAASDGTGLAAVRPQLRQAVESFARQGLIACLVSTESNTTRTGWFIAQYFFGPQVERPFDVLHFSEDYGGLEAVAQRVAVQLPERYSPPTPSGELKLTGGELRGCDGIISKVAYVSGTFVSGRATYSISPGWKPTGGEAARVPCFNLVSADGRDHLQMGAATDGSVFAIIRTRFAEPFVVEIPSGQVDWSGGALAYDLSWDFERIDRDEAVRLTVNGASAFGSPEAPPPAL